MANLIVDSLKTMFDRSQGYIDLKLGLPLLHRKFRKKLGYELNLKNPQTYNEKLQWLKFNTSGEEYVRATDKLEMPNLVREYLGDDMCEGLFSKVFLQTSDADEIDFDELPKSYVIKPNHGSGWVELVTPQRAIDPEVLRAQCKSWLRRRFGYRKFEWPYPKIEPRIMVEELLGNEEILGANDVKFHMIHGKIARIATFTDRFGEKRVGTVTNDWKPVFRGETVTFPKPFGFDRMKKIALELGKFFPYVRVDFLSTETRMSLNELTFFPQSGFNRYPYEYDLELGQMLDLKAFAPVET